MVEPEFNATTERGEPLDVLNRLIEKRSQVLRQATRDATIAVMIDALVSLRSSTLSALNKKKFNIQVSDTGWYGGFSKKLNKPVVRSGVSPYSPQVGDIGKVVWLTHGLKKQEQRHVYKVVPEHDRKKAYYIVCQNQKTAYEYEQRASLARAKQMGGLAKNALGVAMGKISTKNVNALGSSTCKSISSALSQVEVNDSGDDFSVRVTDALDYATMALKEGQSGIDTALKKAANKVAGMLVHFGGASLEEDIGTPFPEVKQRK